MGLPAEKSQDSRVGNLILVEELGSSRALVIDREVFFGPQAQSGFDPSHLHCADMPAIHCLVLLSHETMQGP